MDISVFLAKVLGLYLVIVGIGAFLTSSRFNTIMQEMMREPAAMLLMGVVTLILGILLVVSHNFWDPAWYIVITLLAWIIFLKGVANIWFPQATLARIDSICKHPSICYIGGLINLLIGLYLCYFGFWMGQY